MVFWCAYYKMEVLWNILLHQDKTALKLPLLYIAKLFNLDDITKENNNKTQKKKWPFIPDHPYRILIIGGSGSGKPKALLSLIKD